MKISILTPSFFDYDGLRAFNGGADRYLIELARLIRAMGHEAVLFQAANHDWERNYAGFTIRGLGPHIFEDDVWPETNRRFNELTTEFDHHIYLVFSLAYPRAHPNSISVSHGIWWDDRLASRRGSLPWYGKILGAIEASPVLVANDTNLLNWIRAVEPKLEERCRFIPNFVDTAVFSPQPKKADGRFNVLFPRRLVPQRGVGLARHVAWAFKDHPEIAFRFVGRGWTEDVEEELCRELSDRQNATWEWVEPEEMPAVYRQADVCLIPTTSSEGTSLACLEAMACGRPVIASWVGGLANLIIHEYNGLLLKPDARTIVDAILDLYGHREKGRLFAERSLNVAKAHSIEVWRNRWTNLMKNVWNLPDGRPSTADKA